MSQARVLRTQLLTVQSPQVLQQLLLRAEQVSGISFDHADGVAVQEGEFAHVLREICADLAASYYLEDESLFQTTGPEGSLRGTALRERGEMNLKRLAHLGSVD
jgi:hypothetical protein